jgi:hypothetical protein
LRTLRDMPESRRGVAWPAAETLARVRRPMRAETARRGGAGSLQRAWMAGRGDYTRASRRVTGGEHEGGVRARGGGR